MPVPNHEEMVLHISTSSTELARLHPWLDAVAQTMSLPKATLYGMQVALEEMVMNIAMHGVPADESGEIVIRLRTSQEAVVLVVEDDGRGFDPITAPAPKRPENLLETKAGGFGLTLLHHYCRDISYERTGNRNYLTLSFPRQLV